MIHLPGFCQVSFVIQAGVTGKVKELKGELYRAQLAQMKNMIRQPDRGHTPCMGLLMERSTEKAKPCLLTPGGLSEAYVLH